MTSFKWRIVHDCLFLVRQCANEKCDIKKKKFKNITCFEDWVIKCVLINKKKKQMNSDVNNVYCKKFMFIWITIIFHLTTNDHVNLSDVK